MTNADQERGKAAVVFTGILTVLAGGAGLAVAGLILGFDYLLHGEPSEREQLERVRAERNRQRFDDALAWLEADRADRARARQARRDWFGQDPATRGEAPSSGETVGRAFARAWNALLVGTVRFGRGWKKGREEARSRRGRGESGWWRPEPDHARPDRPTEPAPAEEPHPQPGPSDKGPDIVDAEIVPEVQPSSREVVPVGQDEPVGPEPDLDGYGRRVDDLRNEVEQDRNNHHEDPSPPRTALPL